MQKDFGEKSYNTFSILAIIFGFVFYPLGLIFAIIALSQIRNSGEKGKGLAIAAIIIPPMLIILIALMIVAIWFFIRPELEISSGLNAIFSLII